MSFSGLFQYIFKYCASNNMTLVKADDWQPLARETGYTAPPAQI